MADEGTPGTGDIKGQSEAGSGGTQITSEDPGSIQGQSDAGQAQETTPKGTRQAAEDTFFDPRDIEGKPELQAAYKQMQRDYSKKMESRSGR